MASYLKYLVFLFLGCSCGRGTKGNISFLYNGHIYLPIQINNKISGNFMFDTGAQGLTIDSIFCKNLNLKNNTTSLVLRGAGENLQSVKVIQDSFITVVNGYDHTFSYPYIMDCKSVFGKENDGIIGLDFFKDELVLLNYTEKNIMVLNRNDFDVQSYTRLPFVLVDDKIFIPATVGVNDKITVKGDFFLDTGFKGELLFTNETRKRFNLDYINQKKIHEEAAFGGIGGKIKGYKIRSDKVTIDKFKISKPIIFCAENKTGALSEAPYAGIIGNGVLERFDVVFDLKERFIYLKPGKHFEKRRETRSAGFLLRSGAEGQVIFAVMKPSDAERNGLQIGDIVLKINSQPVKDLPNEYINQILCSDSIAELIVLRKDSVFKVKVEVKDLFNN